MKKKNKFIKIILIIFLIVILLGLVFYRKENNKKLTLSINDQLIKTFKNIENKDKEAFKDFEIFDLKTEKDQKGNDVKAYGKVSAASTIENYLPLGLSFLAIKNSDDWKIVVATNGHEYCSDFVKENNLEQYNFSKELLSQICDTSK